MMWVILIIVVALFALLLKAVPTEPTQTNLPIRETITFNLKDYDNQYDFIVAGVHSQDHLFAVLNYTAVNDLVRFELEPENVYDADAIKVMGSGWNIGYVPSAETYEVSQIIKNDYVAFITDRSIDGYISLTVKIRYK